MKPALENPARRHALATGVSLGALGAGAAWYMTEAAPGGAGAGAAASTAPPTATKAVGQAEKESAVRGRLPAIYVPHGGGPWPFVDIGFGDPAELRALAEYLASLPTLVGPGIKAMVVISAHWEEAEVTIMDGAQPPLLFDYYGFPPASYELTWPAPGYPALAARVGELLGAQGIPSRTNSERGYDHGTFVPLKVAFPRADVPVVQISMKRGLDPAAHLALGRALAPLRDEGVLLVGSGMSYHNMRGFGPQGRADSEAFDAWLQAAVTAPAAQRLEQLRDWEKAPAARKCHPREEHLLPLHVIAGAAGDDAAEIAFSASVLGVRVSAVHFA